MKYPCLHRNETFIDSIGLEECPKLTIRFSFSNPIFDPFFLSLFACCVAHFLRNASQREANKRGIKIASLKNAIFGPIPMGLVDTCRLFRAASFQFRSRETPPKKTLSALSNCQCGCLKYCVRIMGDVVRVQSANLQRSNLPECSDRRERVVTIVNGRNTTFRPDQAGLSRQPRRNGRTANRGKLSRCNCRVAIELYSILSCSYYT